MLAPNPASILDQIFGRAGIALTQESTSDDHALNQPSLRTTLRPCRPVMPTKVGIHAVCRAWH